eukprot:scaffold3136_cov123-Isochrysis_galbana.AAC.2
MQPVRAVALYRHAGRAAGSLHPRTPCGGAGGNGGLGGGAGGSTRRSTTTESTSSASPSPARVRAVRTAKSNTVLPPTRKLGVSETRIVTEVRALRCSSTRSGYNAGPSPVGGTNPTVLTRITAVDTSERCRPETRRTSSGLCSSIAERGQAEVPADWLFVGASSSSSRRLGLPSTNVAEQLPPAASASAQDTLRTPASSAASSAAVQLPLRAKVKFASCSTKA